MFCVKGDLFLESAQKPSGCILVIILLTMPRNHGHTGWLCRSIGVSPLIKQVAVGCLALIGR